MSHIKIMIVDDHQVIRDGIKSALLGVADIEIVEEAASAKEALEKIEQHPELQVVVMDISLGEGEDGISATKKILDQHKGVHILAMSMHDEEAHSSIALRRRVPAASFCHFHRISLRISIKVHQLKW